VQSIKYLGIHLDLKHQAQASHERVLQQLNDDISHLLVQPGSVTVKIEYISFKIIPPVALATAACASWTLAQYRALDKPFTSAYRKLLAFPAKAPEFILYMPQIEMGVGLPRFSDKAQLMKWNAPMRCHAVGGDPAQSMNDFFDRLPSDASSTTDDFRTISPPKSWPRQKPMVIRRTVVCPVGTDTMLS
jgi:hypothetical protein